MGSHKNISATSFPEQHSNVGRKVRVCYNYDTSAPNVEDGVIVRDDVEEPFVTIIHVPSKKKFVLSTECQYQL